MVAAAWLQRAGVCEDLPDGGAQVAAVRGQALQRQGGTEGLHLVVGGGYEKLAGHQRSRQLYHDAVFCLFCSQPVPPSAVEQNQVWLAVNEDGLCVLDYAMVCLVGRGGGWLCTVNAIIGAVSFGPVLLHQTRWAADVISATIE